MKIIFLIVILFSSQKILASTGLSENKHDTELNPENEDSKNEHDKKIPESNSINSSEKDSQLLDRKILRLVISPINLPIISKFADNFHGQLSFIRLDSDFDNENEGMKKLCQSNQDIPILIINRKLTDYEKSLCYKTVQSDLEELKIGYYALIIAAHKENKIIDLSSELIYKAITQNFGTVDKIIKNNNKRWINISKNLPSTPIKFYGPFVLSSPYNFLVNKALFLSCLSDKYLKDKIDSTPELEEECKKVRTDSRYIGDTNDSRLTLSKLFVEKDSYGFMHYGIYERNKMNLQTINFDGVKPDIKNIQNEEYALSFPVYIYIKKNRMQEGTLAAKFFEDIKSTNVIGPNGYLRDVGLIPLTVTSKT